MEKLITLVEEFDDRVRAHYHLKKPDGMPHKDGTKEILYQEISNLPKEPTLPENLGGPFNYKEYWDESLFVAKVNKTIVFHFVEWQETARCREQDFEGGPYLED